MATQTSSLIGVTLTGSNTAAQFALGTHASGGGADWEYVIATGTLTTGTLVYIAPGGTANPLTTGNLAVSTAGMKLAFTQFQMLQGEYGFVALNGGPLYILCSGTIPTSGDVALSATAGVLVTSLLGAVGNTMAGIFITTSASTAGLSCATGLVTFARAGTATLPLG